jgi:hypothetical protein
MVSEDDEDAKMRDFRDEILVGGKYLAVHHVNYNLIKSVTGVSKRY